MGDSSREERQTESKPRQGVEEGGGRVGAKEQVSGHGTGPVRGRRAEPSLGRKMNSGVLKNKDRKIYRILYFNAASLVSKVDLLQTELSEKSNKPDIICICETFCNDQHSDAYLALPGYEIISRRDGRDTTNGIARGLMIYCREGLLASELYIAGSDTVTECTGISVPG